jgi:hypothetical protein
MRRLRFHTKQTKMRFRKQKSGMSGQDRKPRSLEALAFYLGAHRIDPESVAKEIEAGFSADAAERKQAVMERLRSHEARLEDVRRRLPLAESAWERVRAELGDLPPSSAEAITMAGFALFALALDAIFIAPSMDMMNVTDPLLQFVAAAGLAFFARRCFTCAVRCSSIRNRIR